MKRPKNKKKSVLKNSAAVEAVKDQDELMQKEDSTTCVSRPAVWRPGQESVEEGANLEYDSTAYDCLHALRLEYPCLRYAPRCSSTSSAVGPSHTYRRSQANVARSAFERKQIPETTVVPCYSFDVFKDDLGGPRSAFPHTILFGAATQADTPRANYLAFLRLNNVHQGRHGKKEAEDSDADDMSDSDDEFGEPVLHVRTLSLSSAANRIRAMPQKSGVVAVWEDSGRVKVYDGTEQLEDLQKCEGEPATRAKVAKPQPLHSQKHSEEGFALDWSRCAAGRLATGDNSGAIFIWEPSNSAASWTVSSPYMGHSASVEDIQWSPVEETVFASCSADQHINIWDTRARSKAQLSLKAHDCDVNVISWNLETEFLLASGGDEGALRVWDLRTFSQGNPVANFTHHKGPVTAVEWCPVEASMLATTAADGQLAVWDLALERDPEEEIALGDASNAAAPEDLPPQLLFLHGGQTDLKEVHWHPQIPGMLLSTAADGFNVFKPHNVG